MDTELVVVLDFGGQYNQLMPGRSGNSQFIVRCGLTTFPVKNCGLCDPKG